MTDDNVWFNNMADAAMAKGLAIVVWKQSDGKLGFAALEMNRSYTLTENGPWRVYQNWETATMMGMHVKDEESNVS